MISVRQYLFSVGNSRGLTRTLGEIDVCRDRHGQPCCTAGNSAVVFKIRYKGHLCALRCYTRRMRNLRKIYGDQLLKEELFIFRDNVHGEWTDVVLQEWIEGENLHERILCADAHEFGLLAEAFDSLAASQTADDKAHGDLKPENIIVQSDGTLRLIDLDASFLPEFAGQESPELGTAAFQHSSRTASDFDERLDDFPAALIATALHALALDPSLRERYGVQDALLIDPRKLPNDPALIEIRSLFERHGMATAYRIAWLLLSPSLRQPSLAPLFRCPAHTMQNTPPELYVENGLWGFRSAATGETIIPPLYDSGFDFTEGMAAVLLGSTWHFIDMQGNTVLSCPGYTAIKPFRDGKARILSPEGWCEIDPMGKVNVLDY